MRPDCNGNFIGRFAFSGHLANYFNCGRRENAAATRHYQLPCTAKNNRRMAAKRYSPKGLLLLLP
jgi:hypothetical protein